MNQHQMKYVGIHALSCKQYDITLVSVLVKENRSS